MAVAFRSAGSLASSAAGTPAVSYPAGVAANDLLIIHYCCFATVAPTTPAGWTKLFGPTTMPGTVPAESGYVFYKAAAGTESGSLTIANTGAATNAAATMSAWTGADPAAPVDVFATAALPTSGTTGTAPTVTTTKPNTRLLHMVWGYVTAAGVTPNAADTERYDTYNAALNFGCELADRDQAAAGATGTSTVTWPPSTLFGGCIATVAVAPAAAVVTPPSDPPGISIAFTDNWDVASPTWTRIDNVAGRRVRGYTIDRGRPNEFEKTGTGTATVRIADTIGTFDPTDPVAATTVAPGKQANISLWNPVNSTWHTIFRGYVESWRYVLDQTRKYTEVELTLTDGFAILSRYELVPLVDGVLPPYTGTPDKVKLADFAKGNVLYGETVGTVGDRILSILGDAGWPAALATNWISFPVGTIPDVFSGNVRVGPKAYGPGTSALDALFDAADGEFPGVANLYMAANGHVRFRGRQARFRPAVAQYGITPWLVGDPSAWGDANCVPLAELEFQNGEDNLYNSCTATPQGVGSGLAWRPYNPDPPDNDDPAVQTATAPASIAAHGLRGLTFDNLQTIEGKATGNNSKVETALFAAYYVQNYATPHPRISRAVFKTRQPANTHAGKLWEFLCNVEISDLLTVKTDHPGAGGFNADFYVEGIHYTVRPGPPEYAVVELSLDVSPRAHWTTNPFNTDPDPAP